MTGYTRINLGERHGPDDQLHRQHTGRCELLKLPDSNEFRDTQACLLEPGKFPVRVGFGTAQNPGSTVDREPPSCWEKRNGVAQDTRCRSGNAAAYKFEVA